MNEVSPLFRWVAVVVGFGAHLAVGFFYGAAGLVVPGPYLFGLWLVWVALAVVAVRHRRRLGLVLAVPVLAAAILVATVSLGGAVLDWQA